MSGSGRHSSYEDSSGGRTPSSYPYMDQTTSGQRYLRPEDVYRLENEGTYFNATSYTQSRHGSQNNSPRRSNATPPDQGARHQSNPHSPYVEYPYTDLSRHVSGGDSAFESSRRVTPPDQSSTASRHSPTGSHGDCPKDRECSRGISAQDSPKSKGKGKEREDDRHSASSQKSNGGGRHGSGDSGGSRRFIGPSQARLVSGVFIRY